MELALRIVLLLVGMFLFLAFGAASILFFHERTLRGGWIACACAVVGGGGYAGFTLLPQPFQVTLLLVTLLTILAGTAWFVFPMRRPVRVGEEPRNRYDERDIIFARWRLAPDSPQWESYYRMRPENKASDDILRSLPGLMSPKSRYANPLLFAATDASFDLTYTMREFTEGEPAEEKVVLPIEQMTLYIKKLAKFYGAKDVGITELKPYHVYSHIGRGTGTYGDPIELSHRYAIALTVEMDESMIGTAPTSVESMEVSKQYVEVANVAMQLAFAIRRMGYPARAHIEGNYRVICPLVGRDAGLGEIGRMGVLITPRQGPRVRLSVVTTDLPLQVNAMRDGSDVIDFCSACKKCAVCCPSQSIPAGDREEIDGAMRWRINMDTCFRYWNTIGTDCGRCVAVCPYAHPDNPLHNLIRWGVAHSGGFRRAAVVMDDFFYGRKPASRPAPDWTRLNKR